MFKGYCYSSAFSLESLLVLYNLTNLAKSNLLKDAIVLSSVKSNLCAVGKRQGDNKLPTLIHCLIQVPHIHFFE